MIVDILLAYVIGSIPFGLLLTKFAGKKDIRTVGSGNIGATNVFRTSGKLLGLLTFFLDMAKGWVAVTLLSAGPGIYIVSIAVILGHMCPCWLKFKGGKGVATYVGVLLALFPVGGLCLILVWLLSLLVFRISSLSALIMTAMAPILCLMLGHNDLFILTLILSALVWIKHAANIKRLLKGQEKPIISQRKR